MRGHVKESLEYLKGLWSFRHSIRSVSFSGKMSQSDSDYVGTNGPVDRENCSLDFVEIDLLTTSIRFVRMFRCWRTALIDSVAAVDRRRDIGPWKANNWTNTVIDNTLPNTNNENKSDTSRHQQSTGRLSQTLRWHGKEGRTRGCDGGGGRSAFGSGSQDRPIGRGNCKFVPIWPSLSLSPRRPLCVDVSGVESTLTSNPKAWNLSTAAPTPAAGVKIISRQFGRNHPARRLGAAPWGGRSCGGGVGGGPKGVSPFGSILTTAAALLFYPSRCEMRWGNVAFLVSIRLLGDSFFRISFFSMKGSSRSGIKEALISSHFCYLFDSSWLMKWGKPLEISRRFFSRLKKK